MPYRKNEAVQAADEIMGLAEKVVEKVADAPDEVFVVEDAPAVTPEGKEEEPKKAKKVKKDEESVTVEVREARPQQRKRLTPKILLEIEAGKKALERISPTEMETARGKDVIKAYKK